MRRRSYLALSLSTVAGLAGCLSGDEPTVDQATESETETTSTTRTTESPTDPTETTTATPSREVSVEHVALQPSLVNMNTDYLTVHDGGQRYLFLRVSVTGDAPNWDEFSVRLGEQSFRPRDPGEQYRAWRFYGNEGYSAKTGSGLLLFDLPRSSEAARDDATLTWPGGEWSLPDDVRTRLATKPPNLSATAEVPATVPAGTAPTVRITVTNDGDSPGQFVGGLNRYGPSVASMPVQSFSESVPAGETTTIEYEEERLSRTWVDEESRGDGHTDFRYGFQTAEGSTTFEVEFVEDEN
ncbi:hypothetical protein [Haloarchaeobius sp. DFWS5]|uniref:hypothetical protein n=1 Tax=Haloarchaeobius sp. DFWS5 TaxID=3446114 RepID=UPI003EBB2E50